MTGIDGGITIPESPTITDEHKKLVEEARKMLDDSSEAIPFALLGTQVVAGTNYWILCKVNMFGPTQSEKLVTYKINKNLQDEVMLLEATTFEF
ncbi:hypothetical protein C6P52_10860 [Enterococcus mundtii]|uniref:hypothetical protein n=1 Tax=Enterococcus mundtii TaxID=53346 RepID=UPI000D3C8211|nr:hypothetical protein [Enterococcus mundtii]PTO37941.1 hypothetical protein C6P52_10860 [Enterococcus mundtii]PTO44109.1 hypothetical protein C6P54_06575 [Enterococcus mundtii]